MTNSQFLYYVWTLLKHKHHEDESVCNRLHIIATELEQEEVLHKRVTDQINKIVNPNLYD